MNLESIQSLINSINVKINTEINTKTIYSCSSDLILIEKLSEDNSEILKFVEDTSTLMAELNAIIHTQEMKDNQRLIKNIKKQFSDVFNTVMEPIDNLLTDSSIDSLVKCY